MKNQFTAGPWAIKDYDQNQHEVGTENVVVACVLNDIVELEDESRANACLIAAAPDMFDALHECILALNDIIGASDNRQAYNKEELYNLFSDVANKGTRALNKATDNKYNSNL